MILLQGEDESFVKGTTSDDNGVFKLDNLTSGNYTIRISFIGFESFEQNIQLTEDVDLSVIVLKESAEQLGEVELNYTKPTLDKKADRLIFNVQGSALTEGNLLDVLRSTPSVLVIDNSINVRNEQPVVYINDRRVNLSGSEVVDLLQGSSAASIEAVEVITNPSARYDADSGVVLNIVMSKNLVSGYNGSVYANYTQGVYPKQSYGTNNTFKGKGISGFLNYSYNPAKIRRVNDEEVNYPGETWRTNNLRTTNRETHNISASLEFDLSEKDNLSLSSNMLILPYFNYFSRTTTLIEPPPQVQMEFASFMAENLSRDLKHNLGFNLDYRHSFENSATLDINGSYTDYDYRRNQSVASEYFLSDSTFLEETGFRTRSDQDTKILTGQFDFTQPFDSGIELSLGAKATKIDTQSGIRQVDVINGVDVPNIQNSDEFNYDEMNYAGYLNLGYTSDNWNFSFGIRAEQTEVEGVSGFTVRNTIQDYLEWFPSASISNSVSEKVDIYSTYRRSIIRPNYSNLNPFQFFLNDNTIVTGNPELQPVFQDRASVGISAGSHSIEAYYFKREGNIQEIPVQDNLTNIITYTPLNLSDTEEFGLDYLGSFEPAERWALSLFVSVYNTTDEGEFNSQSVSLDQWATYTELTSQHSFLKDQSLSVNLTLNYLSENLQGLQLVESRFLTELRLL